MKAPALSLSATLLALALTTGTAFSAEKRELDSHEHGHATLEIAIDKDRMDIALEMPGESVVGFEHAAKTDEQKAVVKNAMAQLSDTAQVFTLPEAAQCKSTKADVELHQEGDHNAFEAAYSFTCANMSAMNTLETKLFALYPKTEEIDVSYAVPAGQGAAELEADSATVTLPTQN